MQITPFAAETALRLEALFPKDPPVPTRRWAILDGTIEGRIVVDEPGHPTFALIQDLTEGTVYLGGAVTPPAVRDAWEILLPYRQIVVCLWPDDPLRAALPPGPSYEGVAIDFTGRSPAVDLGRLAVLPPGYRMRKIDPQVAPAVAGFDSYYGTMYGSLERAVQRTIGYWLMDGETVVCEAVAGPLTRGVAEMGVETAEEYRGRGLATVVAAHVIRECEALGYRTLWNAAQQNIPSVALARRLGYRTERSMDVLAWSR